jgi:gamma-glutamyltranspeptidase/glutathione hydrolase
VRTLCLASLLLTLGAQAPVVAVGWGASPSSTGARESSGGAPAYSVLRPQETKDIGWNARGKGGAVAAGKAEAVAAGIQMLAQGGNAADAAAATILALAVTDYGSFCIGGEVPLLIYRADRQEVKVLCGVGRAPLDPRAMEWFYANGIPSKGSMKAAPVPGAVDLCVTLLKLHGTKSLEEAVAPTLALLSAGGRDWHPRLALTLRKLVEAERNKAGTREEKLAAARDRFYLGDVADELEAWYVATGAFLRKQDLAAQRVTVEEPVAVSYRGYTVYKCGPWTQGPALCEALRLLEGFDLKGMRHLSADYVHAVTESLKLALADRGQGADRGPGDDLPRSEDRPDPCGRGPQRGPPRGGH